MVGGNPRALSQSLASAQGRLRRGVVAAARKMGLGSSGAISAKPVGGATGPGAQAS